MQSKDTVQYVWVSVKKAPCQVRTALHNNQNPWAWKASLQVRGPEAETLLTSYLAHLQGPRKRHGADRNKLKVNLSAIWLGAGLCAVFHHTSEDRETRGSQEVKRRWPMYFREGNKSTRLWKWLSTVFHKEKTVNFSLFSNHKHWIIDWGSLH